MKISLIWVGKTNERYLKEGIDIFVKRLKHYCKFEIIEIRDIKKFSSAIDLKVKEGKEILDKITSTDHIVLLDEKGGQLSSLQFSKSIEKYQNTGTRRLVFVIGGAFGFSDEMYNRADSKLGLSNMTFSHQMIRVFFLEQLYRGYTIIKNEKYHNE